MFDCQVDALVNTVNCVGVMGAGVALQFKMRYPEMFKDYVRRCRGGLVRPGQPYVWRPEERLFGSDSRVVINFPTKDDWRNPAERGMRNWWKHQQKLVNAGELKEDRVELFKELLEVGERYRRKNQYL